ncbi:MULTISPECIES: hypothetical protein [Actinomadura]|uniref:Uncharacterized protein n=1 Tax=Actinomadura yumaensis TaxID=111807 RepID=A0ABW2CKW7_9ACTN|nr:hypothetical protein [Actinomadura sp. J1-007]MWK40275.1 hypothetical protein [Actinomadura sp. J1-007]
MSVTITVPAKITAGFAVATDVSPADLPVAVRRHLTGTFAMAAAERIGTPRLRISDHRAADSPWDLAGIAAADGETAHESFARVGKAARHIGITCDLPVSDLPFGLEVARSVAHAVAASVAGIVVDLDTGQIPPPRPRGPARFTLADGWIGAWLPPHRDGGRCTADEDVPDSCSCVDLATRGLRRFGLPELRIAGAACAHDLAALNVIRTTAQRLLPLGTRPGDHLLPSELPLESHDFAAFWGTREPLWHDGPVPVRLTQPQPDMLSIGPPVDFPDSLNDWLWDELPPILYELLGCEPDPP